MKLKAHLVVKRMDQPYGDYELHTDIGAWRGTALGIFHKLQKLGVSHKEAQEAFFELEDGMTAHFGVNRTFIFAE